MTVMTRSPGKSHDIRLFLEASLCRNVPIVLDKAQTHYVTRVMRVASGDRLKVFNGLDGEWQAAVVTVTRQTAELLPERQLKPQQASPDLHLLFAPVKKAGTDLIVEKATELGVVRLTPVATARSQSQRFNRERAAAIAREAAEQCERLDMPTIDDAKPLDHVLQDWEQARTLLVLAERSEGMSLAQAASETPPPAALLTGPEGGFTSEELDRLADLPFVKRVSLGPRILRAETAALSAIAIWQSLSGDIHSS